jgi:putative aminopeptidase FrvX
MHSPCEVVHLDDLEAAAKLLAAVAVRITNKTDLIPFPPPAR